MICGCSIVNLPRFEIYQQAERFILLDGRPVVDTAELIAESKKENDQSLFIIFNPPYDERIQVDAEKLYTSIGATLKHGYPGTQAWMITSNMEALKHVGLRPSRRIRLYNGKLEGKLVKYEMYEGSRKAKKQQFLIDQNFFFYFL